MEVTFRTSALDFWKSFKICRNDLASSILAILPNTPTLFISLMLVLLYAYRRQKRKGDVTYLPCPPRASLLWGHELEAFERPAGEFYTNCMNKYGPSFRIKGALGHEDILVLGDPTGLAHLSRNMYNYHISDLNRSLVERLIGRGLPWVREEMEHKRMRRLVTPALTAESVKLISPEIYNAVYRLQARLKEKVSAGSSPVTVNILDYCGFATLDIIGRFTLRQDFGYDTEARVIANIWREQVSLGLKRRGFFALMILRIFPFLSSFPISFMMKQTEMRMIVTRLASASKMAGSDPKEFADGMDLLSILVRATSRKKDPISMDELIAHINTFVVGGHETAATSVSYTLWELSKNPEIQNRLREEVINFAGDPTYDDFQSKLPYLDACCKEGLRMHPPEPNIERVAERRDTIPVHFPITKNDGSKTNHIVIEEGQVVYTPVIAINPIKGIWGDGEVFRPERWMEPNRGISDVKIEGWSNMYTFSDGPRNCVGTRFAIFEWKVIMFVLMRQFIFHDTGLQINSRLSTTLQPYVVGRESEGVQLLIGVTLI